ncbi:retinoid-inducible serine carboxypeptidase [Leptinotarsa decemlineata]|uniref:retinoid-inducible serine carboxypeptidase n=1 Tax=Leptinotarsa decemlineata TaxID=7539 RepID=UPI003D3072CF
MTYAPYLLSMGIIDQTGYKKISKIANLVKVAVESGRFDDAFGLWRGVEYEIKSNTYGVDIYNVLNKKTGIGVQKVPSYPGQTNVDPEAETKVNQIMNGVVKEALNIHRDFGTQNDDVWNALTWDFMTPVTSIVEQLLNTTDLSIAVFSGQLDLIIDTPGTLQWVENLKWNGKNIWDAAPRTGFIEDGCYEGYLKKAKKFAFYWVERAGHMVAADNPAAMYHILRDLTNNFKV